MEASVISRSIFMPLHWAVDRQPKGESVMVSITNPGSADVDFRHRHARLLRLAFRDVKKEDVGMFTLEQAREVARLADAVHRHEGAIEFLVHCHSGQSRSAGVAKWVAQTFGVPVKGEPSDIGTRMANELVVQRLDQAWADLAKAR